MVPSLGQQFYRLAPGPAEQGIVYDEDVNSLLTGERQDVSTDDLGTQKQQEPAPVILAVVQKPVDSILFKGRGIVSIRLQVAKRVLSGKDQRYEKL
jgi:hypothetical protein